MSKILLFFVFLLFSHAASAQLRDDFTDGNFTANPAWTGTANFFTVNAQGQLQSNGPATTGTRLQLAVPCRASTGTTWEFWANLRLATSASNLADVWLMASGPDLGSAATSGYFVRLGGTADNLTLFRKDSAKTAVALITGQANTLASSTNNLVRVRITRSTTSRWTLERDLAGGRTFVADGAPATDAAYQRSAAAGVALLYSSTNGKNFYFDDFSAVDATPPLLLRATPLDARRVDAVCNEAVDPATGALAASYRLRGGAAPVAAEVLASNPAVVRLTFGADLPATNVLEVRQVADLFGNAAPGPLAASFAGLPVAPGFGDLIITEIMADETPAVGLPESEFVEVYNRSATKTLSLRGVRLGKTGTAAQAVFPDTARLLPGQYAVVCGTTRAAQFAPFGKVYGLTNFPALSNGGDQLVLRGPSGRVLFEVAYSDAWYRDARKQAGGWSLEMVDPANLCAGADNWTASPDPRGGTPGRTNAAGAPHPDAAPPALLRAVAVDARTVRLFFSEKLDSAAAANPARYALGAPAPAVARAAPVGPDFRVVDLTLAGALAPSRPTTLTVQTATDCAGNASGPLQAADFALPEAAAPGDVVVNELLFNPRVGAVRFIELLNRSQKYVDIQGFQVGDGGAGLPMCPGPYVLAPGQLVAFSTSAATVQAQYPTSADAATLLAVGALPTWPDDAGLAVLLSASGQEIDRLAYNKSLHLPLLASQDGVSLERIRAQGPSLGSNFHSAAGTVGYATPGRPNSQAQDAPGGGQELTVVPEVFTPDDDGQQDFTTLNYQLDQPGYVGSITVYDAVGRLTRRLLRNESLPTAGFVAWDGLDDGGRKAAVGYYILHVELFRPAGGERREYKKTVVLGARF
ncbi:lamin tail domain-containing protein [Hymenobacter nivis]|uniref:Lamin tail domain-containing protein n=1 Tax=Hymenobacter nivis TaxID=1850093 RepID=A0A502GUF0_9BACT|nr:lamin tail domain-containing protein [Hymenobacter nivis]TPG64596.1 lamin tail domain-containing protein [Hymenobacter nivis]